jgi:hypothetical protein
VSDGWRTGVSDPEDHFARALELRRGGDADLVASSEIALDAALRRLAG